MYPPLHPLFPGISLLLGDNYVNGLPHAATHASGTVCKPGASCYDFWFPVSCEEYRPPSLSHTCKHTHILHHSSHRAGLGSAATTNHSKYISSSVCTYNPGSSNWECTQNINIKCIQWHAFSFRIIPNKTASNIQCISDWLSQTLTLLWRVCSTVKNCCIVRKSLCCKVTRAAVLPHSSQHLICFYSLYTHSHFTCQGGRKTYKCQGTTETTITAVCAHV